LASRRWNRASRNEWWYRIPDSRRASGGVRLSTVGAVGSGQLRSIPAGLRVRTRVHKQPRRSGSAGAGHRRVFVSSAECQRPADLVERVFSAPAPNVLWVADLTYVWTRSGFVYSAFVVDAFSRAIVGWRTAASLRADLALDALEMPLHARGGPLPGLVHQSDRGVPYLAIRYTERLAEAEAVSSVGSRGTATTMPWPRRSTASTRPS
jgi:transposase InsO family protein